MMVRRVVAITAVAVLALVDVAFAQAAEVDQSNYVPSGLIVHGSLGDSAVAYNQTLAQTFTVGKPGILDAVELQLRQTTGTLHNPLFQLFRTSNAVPPTARDLPIFSVELSLAEVPIIDAFPDVEIPFTSIDVSSAGIVVAPGDEFVFVMSGPGPASPPWLLWRGTSTAGFTYAGGNSFARYNNGQWTNFDPHDFGFRTSVREVPEPGAGILFATCWTCAAAVLGRRTRGA
jgi:hypothetical protein